MLNILIGADPEVFVTQNNEFVCAHGLVEGDKENPQPVENGAVQVDGMALEFNIDPASTSEQFTHNIHSVMATLRSMVPEFELSATPCATFSKKVWENTPEEAKVLGCDPDFNAWQDGKQNPTPRGNRAFRTGAGHLHIGWTNGMDINEATHREAAFMVVKQLDTVLGSLSLLLDEDRKRQSLYGGWGACRVKPLRR